MQNYGFSKDVSIEVIDNVLDEVIDLEKKCKIEEKYWIANFNVEKWVWVLVSVSADIILIKLIIARDKKPVLRALRGQRQGNSISTLGKSL